MENLKVKICGMRDAQNINDVIALAPDFLGFIFYPKSPRYVGEHWDTKTINQIPNSIQRVGVFVNESNETIVSLCQKYGITTVQLHGKETPLQCKQLREKGYTIFKAFQIDDDSNINEIVSYKGSCDYFLYDTKSKGLGGSGLKFNWEKLNLLNEAGPFLLSGGITVDDAHSIKTLRLSNLCGVDINSKFEITPAMKDVNLLKTFIKELNQ